MLAGRPMLAWSLLAMRRGRSVAIVVAAPPGKEPDVERVAIDAGVDVRAVPGASIAPARSPSH